MSPSINLKKIFIILFLFFTFPLAQIFDPKTGELIEDQFDPNTGEKIKGNKKTLTSPDPKVSNLTKNNISLGQFNKLDFENIYNNETIYPAPPWYGNSISSKYFKAKKGPYSLNRSEIERELIKFPQSEDLLNDHKKWKLISISTFVTTIIVPVIFSSVEVGIVHIASFYGGIGLTIYSINKFTNKWHEAIWVYNRENIAAQLELDKN
ncbi:MAG: hypothetical protein CMG63_01440 [Candidatus Marinimicrobia bacterium]|nr:hypothetical protein [Candidatus Neomarinimicrobiota bacterium]